MIFIASVDSSGHQPAEGNGQVEFLLSEESADSLARVEGMKKWHVGPTMVRGSKAVGELPKARAKAAPQVQRHHPQDGEERQKKAEKPEKTEEAAVCLEFGSDTFSRKSKVRTAAIRGMMEEILRLDEQAWATSPLFTPEGHCRMKFEGAHLITQNMVVEHCVEALDSM